MSAGAVRNFGVAQRERERRLAMSLDDPYDTSSGQAVNDPLWNAFFGSMREQGEAANAAGYGYRADLGGIGRDGGSPFASALSSADRRTIAGNAALGRYTDEVHAGQRANQAFDDALSQERIGGMQRSYDAQVAASQMSPLPEAHTLTKTEAPGQADKYALRPTETDPRQQILNRLPVAARAQYEQQTAAADAQRELMGLRTAREERLAAGGGMNGMNGNPDDVKLAVQAMKEGTVPPQVPGRASKDYTAIMAESKRQGYDLARATTDWTATQKHVASMNGAQQLRLTQAVNSLPEMLDSVDTIAAQWKGGGFPLLNKANLAAAKAGAYGKDAAVIANKLDAQIADVTADLGNVYMGGNSPTDHALNLASKSLSGDWDEKVLHEMVGLARQNVQIRKNSIANTGVAGASANNPYAPPTQAPHAAPTAGGGLVKLRAPDGSEQDVPADQADHYIKLGAKRVGG